jgi:NAD(P)-dependent dehydrogenase (short-subunit alcohol dehydrogenase family)
VITVNLSEKVVIVTGGSKGIGREVASKLTSEGAVVSILSRNKEDLQKVAKELNVTGIPCDLRDPDQVKSVIDMILKKHGSIDFLINNAGKAYIGPLAEMTDNDWNDIISTNLTSVFLTCRAVIPHMVSRKRGFILNVVSNSGKAGAANFAAYCASKFGEIGLTQSLFHELRPFGIKVAAICPGAVDTQMWDSVADDPKIKPKKEKALTPSQVAEVILFMLKNDNIMMVEPVILPSSLYY